jgi:hypothetical protein
MCCFSLIFVLDDSYITLMAGTGSSLFLLSGHVDHGGEVLKLNSDFPAQSQLMGKFQLEFK